MLDRIASEPPAEPLLFPTAPLPGFRGLCLYQYGYILRMPMRNSQTVKPLCWVGSSKKDLMGLPETVVNVFGYALYLAQIGSKHDQAKPLKGFGSAGVLEIIEDREGNTYRAVYTVRLAGCVFVLHVFQKKSKRGVATPKRELDLIRERWKVAEQMARELES